MDDVGLFPGLVVATLLVFVGQFLLSLTHSHRETLRHQVRLFLWAFCLRFAVSIALYGVGLVAITKDEDASGYLVGKSWQEEWIRKGLTAFDLPGILSDAFHAKNQGYYFFLGSFYFLTGVTTRMAAAALNCFVGALTVVFVYRTARCLFPERVAVRAGWLACFFPSLIIWSAQTLKEPVVIFLQVVALYSCIQLKRSGFSGRHVVCCALAIVSMFPFRFYAVFIAIVAVILALVAPRLKRGTARGSGIGIGICLIPVLGAAGYMLQNEARLDKFDLAYVENFRKFSMETQKSGVKQNFDIRSPTGMLGALAVGFAHLMLAPFPWQLVGGSTRMLMLTPELLMWWWIFFFGVIPGMRYALRTRFHDLLPVLMFIGGMALLYSLMFSNVGLTYRQRAQLLPYLLIFAAVGLELRARVASKPREMPSRATTVSVNGSV